MKKKFRVRVRHFCDDYYVVEYAYYRFILIWQTLCGWRLEKCYDTLLLNYKIKIKENLLKLPQAEELAKSLLSIDDVNKYFKKQDEIKKELKKNFEVKIKEIKVITPYQKKEFMI